MITDGFSPINFAALGGALLASGAGAVAVLVAFVLKRRDVARWIMIAAAACWTVYAAVLVIASLASRERVLATGGEKHICELDCHLAYAVQGARTSHAVGTGADAVAAHGAFYLVAVRVRFDSFTIAAWRPRDVPVFPGPREIALVDATGRRYTPVLAAARALAATNGETYPLSRPLLPGQSYVTTLAFDVPADAHVERLEIAAAHGLPDLFVIGYEHSLWHKKTVFALPAVSLGGA